MKNNMLDKIMQKYFKYLGISNFIFYSIYLINSKNSNLDIRDVIFTLISSTSMIIIPVLYLVIMTKKEKFKNTYIYLNIIIVTMCFDILLLSIGSEFSFIYVIKSGLISLVLFTPIRIVLSTLIAFVMRISKKINFEDVSN
jgi:hypothetical protein